MLLPLYKLGVYVYMDGKIYIRWASREKKRTYCFCALMHITIARSMPAQHIEVYYCSMSSVTFFTNDSEMQHFQNFPHHRTLHAQVHFLPERATKLSAKKREREKDANVYIKILLLSRQQKKYMWYTWPNKFQLKDHKTFYFLFLYQPNQFFSPTIAFLSLT